MSDTRVSFENLKEEVDKALLLFLGQLGIARSSPMLLPETFDGKRFIIKVNHRFVDELKAALALSTKIPFQSVVTSGTLKKASSYLAGKGV